jgi:hypothetical protein
MAVSRLLTMSALASCDALVSYDLTISLQAFGFRHREHYQQSSRKSPIISLFQATICPHCRKNA